MYRPQACFVLHWGIPIPTFGSRLGIKILNGMGELINTKDVTGGSMSGPQAVCLQGGSAPGLFPCILIL
ncbi:MAG TPA: hypothetical protein DD706_09600 [Nitrospiraceae bacterium]|nr:hypothetical protein [Nitrospiraceae bacterium]